MKKSKIEKTEIEKVKRLILPDERKIGDKKEDSRKEKRLPEKDY